MKKNLVKGIALVAVSILGVTGLSLAPANATASNKTVIVQEGNTLSGLNTGVNGKNLVTNVDVLYPTGAGFTYYNNKAVLIRNTAFGTFKILRNDCATTVTTDEFGCFSVIYTIKKGLKYSDGTLITGQDLLMSHAVSSSDYSIKAGLGDPNTTGSKFDSAGYGGAYDEHTRANSYVLSDDNYSVTVKYDAFQPDWQIFGPGPSAVHGLVGLAKNQKTLQSARTNAAYKGLFEDAYYDAIDTSSNFSGLTGDSVAGADVIDFTVEEATKLDQGDKLFGTGLPKSGTTVTEINPTFTEDVTFTPGERTFHVEDATRYYKGMTVYSELETTELDTTVSSVNYDTNVITLADETTNEESGEYTIEVDSPASLGLVAISDDVTRSLTTQTSKGKAWVAANSLMSAIASKWSKSWNITTVTASTNPLLLISNGGFMLDTCGASSCTLVKNPLGAVGGAPKQTGNLEKMIFKFPATGTTFSDTAVGQAIKNGEVDLYSGSATASFWSTVSTDSGVTAARTSVATYEHFDIRAGDSTSKNTTTNADGNCGAPYEGPFKGSTQRAKDLRKAMLLVVPRQVIANTYVGKIFDPAFSGTSPTLNSLFSLTTEGDYDKVVKGSSVYVNDFLKDQDARNAMALALVKKYYPTAGPSTTAFSVKMLTSTAARRVDIALQVKLQAAKVGIAVTNTPTTAWPNLINCNNYDMITFAWSKSAISQTGTNPQYQSTGGNNRAGWNDPALDTLLKKFETSLSATELIQAKIDAEKQLWSNYWTMGEYQWPGVSAWNKDLKNVLPSPLNPNVVWNYWALGF
jgi:ABC-type oligopeptide transport system substrate-binding subunit